jgi:hypothetical protein
MKRLIAEEVHSFRADVRGARREGSGAGADPKRQDSLPVPSRDEILASPVVDNAPANGATSHFGMVQQGPQRPGSPMMDDPGADLDRELAQR